MKKTSNPLSRALAGLDKVVEWTIVLIVGLMVVNIAGGVFFRYVLNSALYWTEELGRYLMIWAGMLGASLAMKEDGHVGVTAIVALFPPVARKVLRTLAHLVVAAFLGLIIAYSFRHLDNLSIQRSSAMEIPMALPYLSVTVGAILMSIENIAATVRVFRGSTQSAGEGKES